GYKLTEQAASQKFEFHIKLDELMSVLPDEMEEKIFNYYFKIKRPVSVLSDKQMNSDKIVFTEEDGVEYGEYFIRCGRFENTYIDDLTFYYEGENFLIPYITTKGNISLAYNQETGRSEEHTSELQSRFDLVCRLLLEKKKKQKINTI